MPSGERLTLFLCGDVMTGRGVDQILAHPSSPSLHEPLVRSALDYVALSEQASGPIPRAVDPAYVWGTALEVLDRERPDVRIANLETSITTSNDPYPKGINYRMHPANAPVLGVPRIDCCTLANNHVLDWGRAGLVETLEILARADIRAAGAGRDLEAAQAPSVLEVGKGARVLVFAFGATDSGIPCEWAAEPARPGVHLLPDFSESTLERVARMVLAIKRPGDVSVASVHWGGNWGFAIPPAHRRFAHGLIDRAGIDVVHGHSSHHPKAVEVYHDRPILYGCGDFLNDYEGISRRDRLRHDLVLMYFVTIEGSTGRLVRLGMTPLQIRRFRLQRPSRSDCTWLRDTLDREFRVFDSRIAVGDDGWTLEWGGA
ncbi:MAG TPA: CapA family protein [Gemmatimonadales bacterium]|nr:CapA family protein [Gemmatimonadales bacterium]